METLFSFSLQQEKQQQKTTLKQNNFVFVGINQMRFIQCVLEVKVKDFLHLDRGRLAHSAVFSSCTKLYKHV